MKLEKLLLNQKCYLINLIEILLENDQKKQIKKLLIERKKKRLLEELNNILLDLEFKKKHINNAFDSSSYCDLKDLEHTFGDLDDYYIPILAKESFGGNYHMQS